jgi:hypothetical protein
MMSLLRRKQSVVPMDPVVAEPESLDMDKPVRSGVVRTRRRAPTGDLTRNIRKDQSKGVLEKIRRSLALSPETLEAVTVELLSAGGNLLDESTIRTAMERLFDCEPVGAMTAHPVILVGGKPFGRYRAALSLTQRIERTGRRVALYTLDEGAYEEPVATYSGGIDILNVGSAEACMDAVRVKEPADLAIVAASCLDRTEDDAQVGDARSLALLALGVKAEIVYVHQEGVPLPEPEMLSGIQRVILAGRLSPAGFGAVLDAAYRYRWAFAGQCTQIGIHHPMTPDILADHFSLSVH